MTRRKILFFLICFWPGITILNLAAQDLDNLQFHGFATQGFLYSSHNNYLTMKSSQGSLQWTEGALSVSDTLSDKLRVGMQIHMYEMGQFGGPNVLIDWASGDYKFDDRLGFRAGKVKVPFGLYNDSQDVDSLFLWVLLPQSLYPDDNRDYDLAELGGQVYGGLDLGAKAGRLLYAGHLGNNTLDSKGGYMQNLGDLGLTFTNAPGGRVYGGDIRWLTPVKGLTMGSSAASYQLDGTGPQGTFHVPSSIALVYYVQWDRGKLHLTGEYYRDPVTLMFNTPDGTILMPQDGRAWYPMIRYDLTKKFQVGTYYSNAFNKTADTSLPENYSRDWVLSGRYNFNSYFYGKIEGHFLHGTLMGYYQNTNPDGLQPKTSMLAARVGFAF